METEPTTTQYPATVTVHTPTGPHHACAIHAGKIVSLMQILGAHANITNCPDATECQNCINGAKKKIPT